MDNVIELTRLWNIIKRSFVWMVVLGIIGGGAAFAVAKFALTPKYSSAVAMLVNRKSSDNATAVQYADQQADVAMINTYKDIITKPVILNKVANKLTKPHKVLVKKAVPAKTKREWSTSKLQYETVTVKKAQPAQYKLERAKYDAGSISAGMLAGEITVTNETNSQVFTVTVTDTNASRAKNIANAIATVFKDNIAKMMSVKNLSVVSKATTNNSAVSPNKKIIVLAGLVLGVMIAFIWGTIRELTDRAVKSVEFLTDDLGLINLGMVQYIGKVDKSGHHDHTKNAPATGSREGRTRRSTRRV